MKSILSRITVKQYLMLMNLCFLAVHLSLIVIFFRIRVRPMAYVNIGSVVCYLACFLLVALERVRWYVLVCYVEILAHSFLAVHYVGDNAGFQMYYLACIAVVLFTHYFSVHTGTKPINGPVLSVISCVLYIFTIVYSQQTMPLSPLAYNTQFHLRVFNTFLVFLFVLAFFSMLTLVASRNEVELVRQTQHDNLTGLLNRRYLTQYMNDLQQAQQMDHRWLAILDIDDFKLFNDRYGHLCGDYVLCAVADVITELCSDQCTVCRWGGEEFLIVGQGSEEESRRLTEKLRTVMADREFTYSGTRHAVTVTIGVAHYQSGQDLDTWINTADARLYKGKQAGKNQIVSAD